jgi:hypothetical protein
MQLFITTCQTCRTSKGNHINSFICCHWAAAAISSQLLRPATGPCDPRTLFPGKLDALLPLDSLLSPTRTTLAFSLQHQSCYQPTAPAAVPHHPSPAPGSGAIRMNASAELFRLTRAAGDPNQSRGNGRVVFPPSCHYIGSLLLHSY